MDETVELRVLAGEMGIDLFGGADLGRLQGLKVGMGGDAAGLTDKFRYAIVLGSQLEEIGTDLDSMTWAA